MKITAGKLIILAMLLLAFAAAATNWLFHQNLAARPMQYWGPDRAQHIGSAPKVELLLLASDPDATDVLEIAEQSHAVAKRIDVTALPGTPFVRRTLLHDDSFDWSATASPPSAWQYAIAFHHADETKNPPLVVAVSADPAQIAAPGQSSLILRDDARDAILGFLAEHFPPAQQTADP